MVLGINFLTKDKAGAKGTGRRYSSSEEVVMACESKALDWEALIKVPVSKSPVWSAVGKEIAVERGLLTTTAGRLLFNDALPAEVPYINFQLGDKELRALIEKVYKTRAPTSRVSMLDAIKDMGFRYATFFGATIGMDDIVVPEEKQGMIEEANKQVEAIQKQYLAGHITQEERYNRVVEVWSKTNEELTAVMMKILEKDKDGFNNIYMMANSGARGSRNQIRQLAGMRGLMAKPSGDIIELPIRSNFKEGLSVIEFFISTNGARKGLADTALKTADAGYLTRRLVDIAQDVVINEEDCGTINGIVQRAIKDGEEIVELPEGPHHGTIHPGAGQAPDHRRDHRGRQRRNHRRDRPGHRGRGHRAGRYPNGTDLRSPATASAGCATAATWPPTAPWRSARRSASSRPSPSASRVPS